MAETERQQADRLLAEAVGTIEAMHGMTDMLDQFKQSLESKGWGTAISQQAAVQIIGPTLAAIVLNSATDAIAKGK